ncbi:hypothetical protein DFH09DRAFT_1110954 [Mycena vulgaris]|nr:hypothetical protein DFH09DRAFT_1110954 [Mycena vulgaris]
MFRSVQWVNVDGCVAALSSFFRSWANPAANYIDARVHSDWAPTDISDLYRLLSKHSSHASLESLTLTIDHGGDGSPHPGAAFRDLFSFANLATLSVDIPSGHDLTDVSISDMARAWPSLEELYLREPTHQAAFNRQEAGSIPIWTGVDGGQPVGAPLPTSGISVIERPPKYRLKTFGPISKRKRNGWSLSWDFLATHVHSSACTHLLRTLPAPRIPQPSLISLNVCRAPIIDASAVARFLSAAFSSRTAVESDEDYTGNTDVVATLTQEYHERWLDVTKILGEVRDDERKESLLGNGAALQST